MDIVEILDYTFIKSDRKFVKLFFGEILFIKGLGNYVEIFLVDKRKFVYYKSLKTLIDKLPDEFMRVHNSYIINLRNVESIEDNHLLIGNHKIAIAKSYRDCLNTSLDNMLL